MTEKEVIDLMESSKNENEWDTNVDIVKKKCNGYPTFWYSKIVASGLAAKVISEF